MNFFICSIARSTGITSVMRKNALWRMGVGTVAETDLLGNTGRVYVIYRDIVLREIAFHPVGKVGGEFVALPDGVEQESAVGLESACHIVHVKISLHVTCLPEIGSIHKICRPDWLIAEAGDASM